VKGTVFLIGKKDRNGCFVTLLTYNYINRRPKFFLSTNGILIQDEIDTSFKSIVPPWLNRQLICGEIDFTDHNLSLNLSRDNIIYDQESVRISSIIGTQITKSILNLLKNPKKFNQSKINHFVEQFVFPTDYHMESSARNLISDDSIKLPWDKSSLIRLIRESYKFLCFFNGKLHHLSCQKLDKHLSKIGILDLVEFPHHYKVNKKGAIELLKKWNRLPHAFVFILCFNYQLIPFVGLLFPGIKTYTLNEVGDVRDLNRLRKVLPNTLLRK
jgi:hypothetical protein